MKRRNGKALAEETLLAPQIWGICSNVPGERSGSPFVQHWKWTVFIGCLCGNVFDTSSFFFFRKEQRRCPSLRGKRPKTLSRILPPHIILKTGHYGTSADNDLSLYLPCLPGPPGLYFKHAWIRGKGGFILSFFHAPLFDPRV